MSEIQIRLVEGDERAAALAVERQVFLEEGFPYDYDRFDAQSRVFGAFDEGRCIGAVRMVAQSPLSPPVLADCEVWDKSTWENLGYRFEELATQAVQKEYRKLMVGLDLVRTAYADARNRGVEVMALILEPDRAEFLNDVVHFACRQIGEIGYKDWDCAPYAHVLDEVEQKLASADPSLYAWFTEQVDPDRLAAPRVSA